MAAGLGYIEFATGDVLTAATANGYLASQTVMVFASAAARTSAITSPQEGMFSYLKDTNATEYYSGTAWTAIGGGGGGSGFTLISRSTFSAQATADIDNVFSSTYETYQIVIESTFSSVDSDLHMQLRYAGPNTETTGYYGKFANFAASYGNTAITNGAQAVLLTGTRTSADQASNGTFYINNVGNGSRNPMGYAIGWGASGLAPSMGSFYQATARAYTGFRLKNASGNISATVAVYGLAKA